jgi:hypothetical protein
MAQILVSKFKLSFFHFDIFNVLCYTTSEPIQWRSHKSSPYVTVKAERTQGKVQQKLANAM